MRVSKKGPHMHPNIAVVGAGYWGKNLIRNFYKLGVLDTICDNNDLLMDSYTQRYPGIKFKKSYGDVLQDKSITGIALATPAVTHFRLAKEALKADKHVFVEKPLALTVNEGRELVAFAYEKSRVLMVGHILQYHNAVLKLKDLVDQGELGKIQYLYSNRLSIGKIRTEENILWSFAPHDISVILMLLGEVPEIVCATGGSYLQQQVADVTLTAMDFASGVRAHIFVSWLHPFKEQKLVVVGDKKMAVFDDMSKEKLLLYPHRIEWRYRIPVASKSEAKIVSVDMEEPLEAECRHFIACTENSTSPKTDGPEGLRVLQILTACQESLNNGGHRIRIADPLSCQKHSLLSTGQTRQALPPYNGALGLHPPRVLRSCIVAPHSAGKTMFFVHDSSYIDDDVEIGENTSIWHFCHILPGSRIGKNCSIGQNVVIGPRVTVGDGCKIQNNVSIYEGITIENDVFCGPSMVFTNVFNPRCHIPRMKELRPTLVKKGATIGANATIICGHIIGSYAFIGAGSVVTKNVPDHALIKGNPGRITGWMCRCGVKLLFSADKAVCETCGAEYSKQGNAIKQENTPSVPEALIVTV